MMDQDGPKMRSNDDKMALDGPMMNQDGAKMDPRWPRDTIAQDGPNKTQDGPRWDTMGQDGLRQPKNRSKYPKMAKGWCQDG